MERVKEFMKKLDYMKCALGLAIAADVLYLLNAIWSVIMFFRLDTSNTEGQYLKERGLLDYIWEYFYQQGLFKVGLIVLVVAVISLFVSYILAKEGTKRIIMAVCCGLVAVTSVVLLLLNIDALGGLRISLVGSLGELVSIILLGIAMMLSFIVFVMDREYRKTVLVLLGSGLWFALGVMLMTLVVIVALGVGIIKVISFFMYDSSGTKILEEKDEYGNVIRRWREE
ncbi:MAG: hypothetical protein IJD40_01825 [Lachnospiraceae bacterium]|nr:hypothetical protein [Lachnospiraceae bacterium]